MANQPDPRSAEGPALWDVVIERMRARDRLGLERYGVRLQAHNGRNPAEDLLDEILDAAVYVQQLAAEWEALKAENARLRAELAAARDEVRK